MDRIVITGLAIDTLVGIHPHERVQRQPVLLDLELATNIGRAAASDDIDDALDYQQLSESLIAHVRDTEFQLIETLAEAIARYVRQEFDVPWLRLTLHKPEALATCRDVALIIERGSRSHE